MTETAVWLPIYIAGMSIAMLGMMGADKRRARLGRRRISERRLLLWALFGGAAGGWIGMRLFRHKTKHRMFAFGLPSMTALHAAVIAAVFRIAAG
jgi:uncharacterized membrane protein YsdA (DUF1294 family)